MPNGMPVNRRTPRPTTKDRADTMNYMSNEQVEQIFDTHRAFLERQLRAGKIDRDKAEAELRDLERWARKNSH